MEGLRKYLSVLLAVLLAVVFVRTMPFTPPIALEGVEHTGKGDWTRQALYLGIFAALVLPLAYQDRSVLAKAVPTPIAVIMLICIASIAWSVVPDIAARRLALTLIICYSLLLFCHVLGVVQVIIVTRFTVFALTAISLVSAILLPGQAFHQPGDPERMVVGSLRGIFYHKHQAAVVAALGAIFAVDLMMQGRKMVGAALLFLSAVVLVLTESRTSVGSAIVSIVAYLSVHRGLLIQHRRPVAAKVLLFSAAVAVAGLLAGTWFWFGSYLSDPEAFTGRGRIWSSAIRLISDRPMLGYGFGSVFQVGKDTPLAQVSSGEWIQTIAHSHNGILDLLLFLGFIGIGPYIYCFIYFPLRSIASLPTKAKHLWLPLFSSLVTLAASNSLLGGKLLQGDSLVFAILTMSVGCAAYLNRWFANPQNWVLPPDSLIARSGARV